MSRPPVDWPIPVYVAEFRERGLVVCRVPAHSLHGRVAPPLQPVIAGGMATVVLALGSGRCLKSACGSRILTREFDVSELFTPVHWKPACQPVRLGNWNLAVSTTAPAIRRLLEATLEVDVRVEGRSARKGHSSGATAGDVRTGLGCRVRIARPAIEECWPARSAFASQEAAEGLLLHPQSSFVPDTSGELVRAIPVHHYARSTVHVSAEECDLTGVATLLDLPLEQVTVDHVLFQKRCTHTYAFPAERIPLARASSCRPRLLLREELAAAA